MRGKTFRGLIAALAITMTMAPVAGAVSPLLREFEAAFIELSDRVGPSVVEISAESAEDDPRVNELFRFFGTPEDAPEDEEDGDEAPRPRRAPTSTGSGFIFDEDGHIITNNHVVANAAKLTVKLHDGTEREAKVIGTDPSTDIAVIKIDPQGIDLPAVTVGDSDDLKVGQFAIAMGSPRGLTGSVSFGHVSGLGREGLALPDANLRFQHFIQTDAAINLGNSGGPLCDLTGNVIGVNIAIVFGANSIGFAIPINRVKKIVPELIEGGEVVRGWLGVSIMDVFEAAELEGQEADAFVQAYNLPDERGAYVQDVTWRGPAEDADLKAEDVIREIDGVLVQDKLDLIDRISEESPGTTVELSVWRAGEEITVPVTVRRFPGMNAARYGYDILGLHVSDMDSLDAQVRAQLGIGDETTGVIVSAVEPDSPAAAEGMKAGDIIQKIAHEEFSGKDAFLRLVRENAENGTTLLLHVKPFREDEVERKFIKVPEDFSLDD